MALPSVSSSGAARAQRGRTRVAFRFSILREKIVAIDLLADPARLSQLDVVLLDETRDAR